MNDEVKYFPQETAPEELAELTRGVKSEWVPMTDKHVAEMQSLLAIDAAKTELRRVAMVMHNEARAVLQNVFLCPADVSDAMDHLSTAYHIIEESLRSPIITNSLNLTKQ